jgi:hypothetical protein
MNAYVTMLAESQARKEAERAAKQQAEKLAEVEATKARLTPPRRSR